MSGVDGTEERVLSLRTESVRCKIHRREVSNWMRVNSEASCATVARNLIPSTMRHMFKLGGRVPPPIGPGECKHTDTPFLRAHNVALSCTALSVTCDLIVPPRLKADVLKKARMLGHRTHNCTHSTRVLVANFLVGKQMQHRHRQEFGNTSTVLALFSRTRDHAF